MCLNYLSESCLIWGMPMYLWKCSSTLTTPCSRLATSPYCLFLVMALQHRATKMLLFQFSHCMWRWWLCSFSRNSWKPPTLLKNRTLNKETLVTPCKKKWRPCVDDTASFCFCSTQSYNEMHISFIFKQFLCLGHVGFTFLWSDQISVIVRTLKSQPPLPTYAGGSG